MMPRESWEVYDLRVACGISHGIRTNVATTLGVQTHFRLTEVGAGRPPNFAAAG